MIEPAKKRRKANPKANKVDRVYKNGDSDDSNDSDEKAKEVVPLKSVSLTNAAICITATAI